MAFDPKAYLAKHAQPGGFDPKAYLAKVEAPEPTPAIPGSGIVPAPMDFGAVPVAKPATPGISGAESFAGGVKSGATLGFRPAVAGVGAGLAALTQGQPFERGFESGRTDELAQAEAERKANPGKYLGGSLVGGALPAALTGGIASPVVQSAVLGTVSGVGQGVSEGKSASGVALEGVKGAFIGSVSGAVFKALGNYVTGAPKIESRNALANLITGRGTSAKKMANAAEQIDATAREFGIDKAAKTGADEYAASVASAKTGLNSELAAAKAEVDKAVPKIPIKEVTKEIDQGVIQELDRLGVTETQANAALKLSKQIYKKHAEGISPSELRESMTKLGETAYKGVSPEGKAAVDAKIEQAMHRVLDRQFDIAAKTSPEAAAAVAKIREINPKMNALILMDEAAQARVMTGKLPLPKEAPGKTFYQAAKGTAAEATAPARDALRSMVAAAVNKARGNPKVAAKLMQAYRTAGGATAANAPELPGAAVEGLRQTMGQY